MSPRPKNKTTPSFPRNYVRNKIHARRNLKQRRPLQTVRFVEWWEEVPKPQMVMMGPDKDLARWVVYKRRAKRPANDVPGSAVPMATETYETNPALKNLFNDKVHVDFPAYTDEDIKNMAYEMAKKLGLAEEKENGDEEDEFPSTNKERGRPKGSKPRRLNTTAPDWFLENDMATRYRVQNFFLEAMSQYIELETAAINVQNDLRAKFDLNPEQAEDIYNFLRKSYGSPASDAPSQQTEEPGPSMPEEIIPPPVEHLSLEEDLELNQIVTPVKSKNKLASMSSVAENTFVSPGKAPRNQKLLSTQNVNKAKMMVMKTRADELAASKKTIGTITNAEENPESVDV